MGEAAKNIKNVETKVSPLREFYDRKDPSPWLALEADHGLPMSAEAKRAWVKDSSTWSRQFFLPIVKIPLRIIMAVIQLYKVVFPKSFTSSKLLHKIIVWGLKTFVTPEGNYLFVRHFHLGSQVLDFLSQNIKGVNIKTNPLHPKTLDEFKEDLVLIHDINLYNFVIDLNLELEEKGLEIAAKEKLDFSMLQKPDIKISDFPDTRLNVIDVQTAIEVILPVFQLLLTDREFWRSTQSLQLDETMGIYFAKLLKMESRLFLVNNKHPLVPVATHEAGHRLALHSLSTEVLHEVLMRLKNDLEV